MWKLRSFRLFIIFSLRHHKPPSTTVLPGPTPSCVSLPTKDRGWFSGGLQGWGPVGWVRDDRGWESPTWVVSDYSLRVGKEPKSSTSLPSDEFRTCRSLRLVLGLGSDDSHPVPGMAPVRDQTGRPSRHPDTARPGSRTDVPRQGRSPVPVPAL